MHALFAHDHVFTEHAGRFYSPGRLPYSAWQRYLQCFDTLAVLARVRRTADPSDVAGMQLADGPRVQIVGLPETHGISRAFSLRAAMALATQQAAAADAVIARVPSDIGLLAAAAARRAGRVLAVEVVASAWHSLWYHGSLLAKGYAPLLHARTRAAIGRADFALYVTRQFLQDVYPCSGTREHASNVVVAIDESTLQSRERTIAAPAAALRLGFVGSLHARYKGLDTALQALASLPAGPSVVLEVAGEGPLEPWQRLCRRLGIEDKVVFHGGLPGSAAVLQWLDGIDVYLHPSRAEGLPRSLIEAMSRGCLCLASRVGGIPELLEPGEMHAPGDWRSLAAMIEQARCSAELRNEAARRNIEVARRYEQRSLEQRRDRFFASVAAAATAGVAEREYHQDRAS